MLRDCTGFGRIASVLNQQPQAVAKLRGSGAHSQLFGEVYFYQTAIGVLVAAQMWGLPLPSAKGEGRIFGFHIHSGSQCAGDGADPFSRALGHYDPSGRDHPFHAGDMPPLFGAGDYAFGAFLTDRFSLESVLGKAVILHGGPDDFTTQPAGNAGERIACGIIEACWPFAGR